MGDTTICRSTANHGADTDETTTWDPEGLVSVTVRQGGTILDVNIEPAAYTYLTPKLLAETINKTHAEAVTALREATVAKFMDLCGVKLSPAEVANGRTRIHSLLDKLAGRTLY